MFKNLIRYFANINEPKIICSGCRHPIGKQYSIGVMCEGHFCSQYFFCGECVKKASEEAFNDANEKGEVPEKYYQPIVSYFRRQSNAENAHILIKSEKGREMLKDYGYFDNSNKREKDR